MELDALTAMVAEDAALRRRRTLQPVGGVGDKIFPPTYPGEGRNASARHVYERRIVAGPDGCTREVWCVLVDSVQSQANRLEEGLVGAIRDGVAIPHVAVDFSGEDLDGIATITSLDAPHRVYDAILRDSLLDGEPFMKSELGLSLSKARPEDASALLETSPTALLFGAWHSTGAGGGIGAKFARALVSEIVAVGVPVEFQERRGGGGLVARTEDGRTVSVEPITTGRRTGSRIDPLGVLRAVEVYKGEAGWDVSKQGAGKGAKPVRPSEINHGNIAPSVAALGITCERAEHSFVLSFAALRRLRFGGGARDAAGRTLLAALGLLALAEQDARGYALRSRCDLVPDGPGGLEQVRADGTTAAPFAVGPAEARALYAAALAAARAAGFRFRDGPLTLKPQPKLVHIVRESQRLALAGEGGEADGETP